MFGRCVVCLKPIKIVLQAGVTIATVRYAQLCIHPNARCQRGFEPPKHRSHQEHCAWYEGGPYDGGYHFVSPRNTGRLFFEDDGSLTHWYCLIRRKNGYRLLFVGSDPWRDNEPPRRAGMIRNHYCSARKSCFYKGPRP